LQHDPEARLLIVIPRLVHYLPRVRRALAAALDTDGAASNTTALYAFESGVPLVDYPLIETALTLLRCATGTQVFLAWSVLLRSPYLDCGGWRWRAQFERWLRLNNVTEMDWNRFRHLPLRCGSDPQGSSLQSLDRLLLLPPGGETSAAAWAQHFAALLEAAGWPGPNPGSNEQQVRLRFEQLLGEMAAAHEAAGPLDQLEALELLGAWAQRARFEVASGDVAVTVTDSIDEPLVRYDGIWVAGLSADVWPPAASGDAFIPFSILAGSGMSTRSAAGQQQRARGAMQAWESATTTVVYSWPRQLDDAELEPSPLLAVAAVAASATGTSASASERLHPWRSGRMQLAAPTESCGADMARPWPRGQHARGGVSLIQSQALCPFRASATARLQCRPLPAPVDGMPPPLHGQIVHRALQGLWRELGDSAALALPEGHLRAVIEQQVAKAIVEFRGRTVMRLAAAVWQIEQRRCIEVIARLLPLERQREPFSVLASETELQLVVGGLPLSLRLDRVDQLPGASLHTIIIDYKTGKPAASADWLAERPAETQLLLYAEGAGDELCAVATLHAHTSEVRFSGVADQVGRLPRVGSVRGASWPELRSLWHERMSALGAAFVAGVADVAPQKRACDYCHLRVLCRVDADRVGDDVAAGADGGDDE
jgi:probable DNA repair protein